VKVLYLLRHAKSDWAATGLPDIERPLSERGIRVAPKIGAAMRKIGIAPGMVLCSAAQRAAETWALLLPELAAEIRVKTMRSLYLASPSRILSIVHRLPRSVPSALVLAHNPGLHSLALALAGSGSDRRAMGMLQEKYPTGALVEFRFPVEDWAEVRPGSGQLVRFLRPRDLD
jgi:phosphohistidine phosphatase